MTPEEIAEKIFDKYSQCPPGYSYAFIVDLDFTEAIKEAIKLHEASKKQLPEYGKPVMAIIKHYYSQRPKQVDLFRVNEGDCEWRFSEDNCELASEWEVIYWQYAPEVTNG